MGQNIAFYRISKQTFDNNTTYQYKSGGIYFVLDNSSSIFNSIYVCTVGGTKSSASFEKYSSDGIQYIDYDSIDSTVGVTIFNNPSRYVIIKDGEPLLFSSKDSVAATFTDAVIESSDEDTVELSEYVAYISSDGSKNFIEEESEIGTKSYVDTYKQEKLVSGTNIKTINNESILGSGNINIQGGSSPLAEITYTNLKSLRDNSQLVPGIQYRITDYHCTTTQENTTSADHQFDIIVVADDESTLNENARAIQHSGDTYFSNSKLEAWELKYCLDNDTNRFKWADTGITGKGIIYWMKDEFSNECPYDFKNIQFYRKWNSTKSLWCDNGTAYNGVAAYTFSSIGVSSTTSFTDYSLSINNNVYSNVIKEYIYSKKQMLNNICFFGVSCWSNTFRNYCYSNTFGTGCYGNDFGNYCYSNTFGTGCYYNNFENYCWSNTFGNYCYFNTFGYGCDGNTFGQNCYNNTFGDGCLSNTFRYNCSDNTFGDGCYENRFGDECRFNTFGDGCLSNTFASDLTDTVGNFFLYNTLDKGVSSCTLYNTQTASDTQLVKNYYIKSSIVGTYDSKVLIEATRNLAYDTTVAQKSNGKIVQYCEADLIADQD